MNPLPDFRSKAFLLGHMREIMDFHHPICVNSEDGGYYNEYRDDGFITDRKTQHIVSTTRFIFNFSIASNVLSRPDFIEVAAHGLAHLDQVHRDFRHGATSGYSTGARQSTPPNIAMATPLSFSPTPRP